MEEDERAGDVAAVDIVGGDDALCQRECDPAGLDPLADIMTRV